MTSSLLKLPLEIVQQIITQLEINSTNFLLDFVNVLLAMDVSNDYNSQCYEKIIEIFKSQIVVMDLTDSKQIISTPLLTLLRRNFLLDIDKLNETIPDNSNDKIEDNDNIISKKKFDYKKLVLIIDDTLQLVDETLIEFENIFQRLTTGKISIDIIYCPCTSSSSSPSRGNNYLNSSILRLLNQFESVFKIFNTLIIEFQQSTIQTNRNFFDILNYEFFIESNTITKKTLTPRCKKISFPSIKQLKMDYLTIDSFIYKILERKNNAIMQSTTIIPRNVIINGNNTNVGTLIINETSNFIEKLFIGILKDIEFYLPNLQSLEFYNYNNEETCNFIDLSTLVLKKFNEHLCPLKFLFDLHSFKNWNMPNLTYFTGHRFKYDESKMSGSTERMKRSLSDNIKLLHKIAMNETSDATPYFRVSLIPKGVKRSKIINWLPSNSPNSFRSNGTNIDNQNNIDLNDIDDNDDYYDSNGHYSAPSDLSERNQEQNFFNKPILCLKNDSIETLELRLLTINKNTKSIYIQGLFMTNLKELIIQNFTTITKRAKISDKRNSIVLLSPTSSNQNRITPVSSNNTSIDINVDTSDIDDIHPIGFSSWNSLPSCEFIHFSTNQSNWNDKILLTENLDKKQISFLFKIKNLKRVLPKINLAESFDNFIDERQKYIIV
ncbi:similar to Saccharomyces cerevisiae YLR267W BOP2 Protein of unknown function [Maudiozyma saulgeensis]|uniref:Uncharacterized protein n=1 Tax=Maudiozyma saulgeensis TaxID=1789683 RepID=A0A1X7R6L4_9SACH|nr:similar to Saccharomyces cerevisiae YLR267W BOP2 Protein of unknown function [Kazachstania saulgeensis]